MPKFLLMVNHDNGVFDDKPMDEWEPEEVTAHMNYYDVLGRELHPVLTPASQVALTLRAVGGLSTAEIARAYLVPEATMAQRLSRAKQRLQSRGASFAMPERDGGDRAARLRPVLHVLYLVFNEGYTAASGPHLHRVELAAEAIRLARKLHRPLPGEGEASALLDRTMGLGRPGEYRVQAAIAALHDRAALAGDTDWPQILALYGMLERLTANPVVTLNKAVALAMAEGPAAGLTTSIPERRYLLGKAAGCR